MRRCKCLRYKELQLQKKGSRAWVYDDTIEEDTEDEEEENGLVPLEAIYPLVDFDCGNAIPICPYYLYIQNNIRISLAFFKRSRLSNEDIKLIEDAVEECPNRVKLSEMELIEERHAMILILYAKKHKIEKVDASLFEQFYDFIQYRQKYLDISPCLNIAPRYHDERMECINSCWIEAFEKYLKERT